MDTISMTPEELASLKHELADLESGGRSQIAARIKTAREWGDLKENGEYHAAKEAQAHLETRILRLREQLRAAVVVESVQTGTVAHASVVTVTDLGKQETKRFTIVSPNDAKPSEGLLSSGSPIARALIGHGVGDVVQVAIPAGVRELRVDAIE